MTSTVLSFIRRKIFRISKYKWDHEYSKGRWDGLRTQEMQRFYAAKDLLKKYTLGRKILEIGCGEGNFYKNLSDVDYSFFEGIDFSDVAISKTNKTSKSIFAAANMETYIPENKPYAVIVLNEVIYYSKRPIELLKRYNQYLEKDGVFLVGMYDTPEHKEIWQRISSVCSELESINVKQDSKEWTYKIIKLNK